MGDGTVYRCKKCGHEYSAYSGTGFSFPQVYEKTVEEIRNGTNGQAWKELFENTPGAAINAEQELYVCRECGYLETELNLSIYKPKSQELPELRHNTFAIANPAMDCTYVMPYELKQNYNLVKVFPHKCPTCGKRMHLYDMNRDTLKCPKCHRGSMEVAGSLLWD